MAENVFEAVKQSVSTRDAAAFYGIEVKRNGMACCPFHDDKNPSMKLNEEYFYCFGCGATGDVIDLGGRELEVFHIPGHTPGSILLLDRKCRVLLSGDTCARRLLYGLHEQVSFEEFCASLENLKTADFDVMYSAHDRCAIPKEYLYHMRLLLKNEVPQTKNVVDLPGIGEMKCFFHGDIRTLDYFDIAFMEEPIKDISKIRLNVQ